MSIHVNKEIEQFKRNMLADRLAQCSQGQRDMFARLFPEGVPEDKLVIAIDLCDRTIVSSKNKA